MTRTELDSSINAFCSSLRNEAQFIAFENEIFSKCKGALLAYAKKQINFIKSSFRNGIFKPIPIKHKQQKSTERVTQNKRKSKGTKLEEIPYRFLNKNYSQIARIFGYEFSYLKSLIQFKNCKVEIEEQGIISVQVWNILRTVVNIKMANYSSNSGKPTAKAYDKFLKSTLPSKSSVKTVSGGLPSLGMKRR